MDFGIYRQAYSGEVSSNGFSVWVTAHQIFI